jgi:predicted alpha/beta superfamily hydrolase
MKQLILALCLITLEANAQTIIDNRVTIGVADTLYSNILGETQQFWVSLPTNYDNPRFLRAHYPVIYVFDGDANFATVASMARQLSVRNGNTVLPEAIVVGIMNNHRNRDFTPYPSSFWVNPGPSPLKNTGGGERFAAYLQNELIPHIDSMYSTTPYRVLIGHSLGGLAATNMLINHTRLFNAYIIIDPSLWYDNQGFLRQAQKALRQKSFDGITAYLGMANDLPPGMDTLQLLRDTTLANLHMRSIFQFRNALEASAKNGIRFNFGYYPHDTHMSAPMISEYDGIRFIFDFYPLDPTYLVQLLDPKDTVDPARLLTAHFQQVSRRFGYTTLPSESLTNNYANTARENGLPGKALRLYQLNAMNYPGSYGAWESLGDFYNDSAQKEKAAECYRKALSIKDIPAIKEKMNKLNESH